ncbi:MAG: hypothetical protein ACOYOT_01980 [Bacteroidales bacterium]
METPDYLKSYFSLIEKLIATESNISFDIKSQLEIDKEIFISFINERYKEVMPLIPQEYKIRIIEINKKAIEELDATFEQFRKSI